ncbi:hypothetical protein Ddc_18911 [Ditylenchus destructor]|nr:hypothetical protein Ddc_18911 [Ditylenchus destructor]
MFKRKKNITVVSQKQKFVISLPSDVWSEILRYFSRKQLCSQIYLVNRQLYDLASSRHNVPTIHVISITYFITDERPRTFLNVFKSKQYNYIRFGGYKTLETQQLKKLPIPGPFVHFQQVNIWRLLGKSTLKFLRDAKESFVGSAIHYSMINILDNKDMRNQMHYLLQNVFHKPSYISTSGSCWEISNLKVLPDELLICSRMKLYFYGAFNGGLLLCSDFVITFLQSSGNQSCLEGDHKFTLNKMSSNERLSFFTQNEYWHSDSSYGRVYSLWYRRVIDEAEDLKMAVDLQNLEKVVQIGN